MPVARQLRDAVVLGAVRTPTGKGRPTGQLAGMHPADLLAQTLRGLVDRVGLPDTAIEDVIAGCVSQVGEQSSNIARIAALAADFPEAVPGTTLDRKCGSSQQAVHFAAQGVMAGAYDVVIAGGVEMMSRVPMFSATGDADPHGQAFAERYPDGLVGQGISAELVAARWSLSRRDLDEYAMRSQQLACAAQDAGRFDDELLSLVIDGVEVSQDEGLRPGTTVEALASLPPAFENAEIQARFPEIEWSVHAGNSSQAADGAAAAVIASAEAAERLGLAPLARFRGFSVVGSDPIEMLTGVIPATRRVLDRAELAVDDIDLFEVNEAFAPVVLAWQKEVGADMDRVNVNGGAIANGHPLGATGAKLLATLVRELRARRGRYALQTVCEAGGMSNALIVEAL